MPIKEIKELKFNLEFLQNYLDYLEIRIKFLLKRFRNFPNFPGVQAGYNSVTGNEYAKKDIFSFSWPNGRGVYVFSRFSEYFPSNKIELMDYATHTIKAMEKQFFINNNYFPYIAYLNGKEKYLGCERPKGYKSYSYIDACFGFIEYGFRTKDNGYISFAKQIFDEIIKALDLNIFITEGEPTLDVRIPENPWSCALDLSNEFMKDFGDKKYLDISTKLIKYLLDKYYIKDLKIFIEYTTPGGEPFLGEEGEIIVNPGHSIEFCSFCLEFARIAKKYKGYETICEEIDRIIPDLLIWNIKNGWSKKHPGIYRTINAKNGLPIDNIMPWWVLPEAMLAVMLAFERTINDKFLEYFKAIHNTYFLTYMNPKTEFGPFQNIDGSTGKPTDGLGPVIKFQDPEFHSGKNLLMVTDIIKRNYNI